MSSLESEIDFLNTPFKVIAQGVDWKQGNVGVMRAGINSFGVGGTNAHMVLEEAPEMEKCSPDDDVNILLFPQNRVLTEPHR